jgi:phage terminase large subunit-like protein
VGQELGEELGEDVVFGMGQGFMSMGPAWRQFERLLLAKRLHHGGNPVLRWMADNVSLRLDPAGNAKPDKAKSQGKIDGIVALLMALDRALRQGEDPDSVYDERGLLVL